MFVSFLIEAFLIEAVLIDRDHTGNNLTTLTADFNFQLSMLFHIFSSPYLP